MRTSTVTSRCVCLSVGLAFATFLGSTTSARAGGIGVIVPAYFYPGTGGPGGVGDGWAAMAAAASQVPITAILNPDSGPLPGPADPNYVNAMTNLENAGGHVVAYLYTDNGNASLSSVEGQIGTYVAQYGGLINGFFLDGMFVIPSTLSYYQSLASFIRDLSPSDKIIGNPGQPFLNGVSPADYLSTADVFNTFEGPNASFSSYPYDLTWYQSYPRDRFSNVIYDVPTSSEMLADLSRAVGLNAGDVYITDGSGGNPYGQLPSYWDQEVSAIASLPEPCVLTNLVTGGMGASVVMTVAWCRRRRRA